MNIFDRILESTQGKKRSSDWFRKEFFDELKTSSQNMKHKYTSAVEFNRDDGANHNNSVLLDGCTPFWNLYSVYRYGSQKTDLANAGFKYFSPDNANSAQNWLRDSVGSSRYSRYWKVFYR